MREAIVFILALVCFGCAPTGEEQRPVTGKVIGGTEVGSALAASNGLVSFKLPTDPMVIGSFVYVPIEIDPKSGLSFDDLEFVLPKAPDAGMISLSKDTTFDPTAPTILLGAGAYPGHFGIEAYAKGSLVGEGWFAVTGDFRTLKEGPPRWFAGSESGKPMGPAWGGGPSDPQNLGNLETIGTRRLAIVLIDTATERYDTTSTTNLNNIRKRWLDETIDGSLSSAAFYRENSIARNGSLFDLSGEIFGPVQLPGKFDEYFATSGGCPLSTFWSSAIAAADPEVNYKSFDSIVFVSQSATTEGWSAWPCASIGEWSFKTQDGDLALGVISMPNEWGLANNREIYESLSHELGHNLGLRDQYVDGGNIGVYDMMHADDAFPHFATPHKAMLGWIPQHLIITHNFASDTNPLKAMSKLAPAALGGSATDPVSIEVRKADGWNYYFEFRGPQYGQIADQNIPHAILGTDFVSYWNLLTLPMRRPALMRLDPGVLFQGDAYSEMDYSDPSFPTMFEAHVQSISPFSTAEVQITYDVIGRPDPSIRPWPASAERPWQSPDIEVRNMRNLNHPEWFNVPWEGNPNDVIARITNRGTLDAPNVRADFYVKDYTISSAPEYYLGMVVQDVPANKTVEFHQPWIPPTQGHFCIIVRIGLYWIPGTSIVELTEMNNVAQSNYTRYISRTASPSTREMGEVTVGNPLDHPAVVSVVATQTNPLYRTYIENSWLYLDAGETRKIRVMSEYAGVDAVESGASVGQIFDKFRHIPNRISLKGVAVRHDYKEDRDFPIVLGGAEIEVVEGLATYFDTPILMDVGEGILLQGRVLVKRDGSPAPQGTVLLTLDGKSVRNISTPMVGNAFSLLLDHDWDRVRTYYLPPAGVADATSEWYKRP